MHFNGAGQQKAQQAEKAQQAAAPPAQTGNGVGYSAMASSSLTSHFRTIDPQTNKIAKNPKNAP
jgi:hypothetical protein